MAVYEYACPRCGRRMDITGDAANEGQLLACQACSHDEEMIPLFLIDVREATPPVRLWH